MILRPSEQEDLKRLLGLLRAGRLGRQEEQRLRYVLHQTNPAAFTMDLGRLLDLGLYVVGYCELLRIIEAREAAAVAG